MQRRLIPAPGTTTDRWVYLLMYDVAVREVVVMATCFSKNAKGPQRPGDPPAPRPTDQTCIFLLASVDNSRAAADTAAQP